MITNIEKKLAGISRWQEEVYGQYRNKDNVSWYDLSVSYNNYPCHMDTAIIVTSWRGQLKWLKATLEKYRLSGAFVILAYDNPLYGWVNPGTFLPDRDFPNQTHYLLAHSVVTKHITYDADKRNGWFWSVRYAQGIIKQFKNIKYVFCTNGDCIWDKPEGLRDVINLLGDNELMSGQSWGDYIHTASVLYKADAFNRIVDEMADLMSVPVIGAQSPEHMLSESCKKLGIKVLHAPKQPKDKDGTNDAYACYSQESTWKELLGFRNLFAEQETAWNNGLEPLDKKYVDNYQNWIYFAGDERETVCRYYDTNDRRYVYQWWDRGEDSWYNRLYYPITHYGSQPIYKE